MKPPDWLVIREAPRPWPEDGRAHYLVGVRWWHPGFWLYRLRYALAAGGIPDRSNGDHPRLPWQPRDRGLGQTGIEGNGDVPEAVNRLELVGSGDVDDDLEIGPEPREGQLAHGNTVQPAARYVKHRPATQGAQK